MGESVEDLPSGVDRDDSRRSTLVCRRTKWLLAVAGVIVAAIGYSLWASSVVGVARTLTTVSVIAGAFVLLFCLCETGELLRSLNDDEHRIAWRTLWVLMALFLGGYLSAAGIVLAGWMEPFVLLAGVVFLLGALFVLLVVWTGQQTIEELRRTTAPVSPKPTANVLRKTGIRRRQAGLASVLRSFDGSSRHTAGGSE